MMGSFIAPLVEPWLTGPPYHLSLQQVSLWTMTSTFVSALGMICGGIFSPIVGIAPLFFGGLFLSFFGLMMTGPVTYFTFMPPPSLGLAAAGAFISNVGSAIITPPATVLLLAVIPTPPQVP